VNYGIDGGNIVHTAMRERERKIVRVQGSDKQEANLDGHKLINIISSKGKSIEGASDYEFRNEDREDIVVFECSLKEAVEKGYAIKKPKRRKKRGLI